ncbi:hypothetical protein [Paenibacillus solanacearum]|uniref:hypothetical protein n=1 Tax=Paenibacillus solanacearum TaxID=2048548 RepID=UPI001C405D6A|nr:hypothetical protein [Paenibacillus solanacearum]
MELYIDLAQFIFSIGLVMSLAFLPFMLLSAKEPYWNYSDADTSAISIVPSRLILPKYLHRWISRTIRRKEAPNDDTDYSPLVGCITTNREDLYEHQKTLIRFANFNPDAANPGRMRGIRSA